MTVLTALSALAALPAAEPTSGPDPQAVKASVDKALAFLRTRQGADGSFSPRVGGPGVTALVAAGLVRNGRADDPVTTKALGYLEKNVKPDGGIYSRGLANYTTCVALVAFKEANAKGAQISGRDHAVIRVGRLLAGRDGPIFRKEHVARVRAGERSARDFRRIRHTGQLANAVQKRRVHNGDARRIGVRFLRQP